MAEKFPELDDVRKDIAELRSDLAALAKDMKTLARKGAPRQAASALEALQETAESTLASVTEQGLDAARSVEKSIKSRPVESLLVAFGVGVLLGNVIRR